MGFIDVGAALVVAFVCTSYSRYYLHMLQSKAISGWLSAPDGQTQRENVTLNVGYWP